MTQDTAAETTPPAEEEGAAPSRVSTVDFDAPAPTQKREIVVGEAGAAKAPIIPRTIAELSAYATWVIAAGMVPKGIEVEPKKLDLSQFDGANNHERELARVKAADKMTRSRVMIVIEKGLEVGMGPMTALSTIMIVNNRPCVWGDGAVALCQQFGKFGGQEFELTGNRLTDDWTCTFKVWRKGVDKPFIGIFTYRTAKTARLLAKKGPWTDYPDRMMFNRARAFALRDGFADCLMGLGIREELEDMPEPPQARADRANSSFLDDGPAAVAAATGPRQIEHAPGETVDIPKDKEPVPAAQAAQQAQAPAATAAAPAPQDQPETSAPAAVPGAEALDPVGGGTAIDPLTIPPEPATPRYQRDIPDYTGQLIAWARVAPWTDLQRHIQAHKKQMDFIRENRTADWDVLAAIIDGRRP